MEPLVQQVALWLRRVEEPQTTQEARWLEWLQEFGLHDPIHSEQQAYERYLRVSKIELGSKAVPRGERWQF